MIDHRYHLEEAYHEALKGQKEGQNPIGCVIIDRDGKIIARAHNLVSKLKDPMAHAEINAIRSVISGIDESTPRGWTLYTTIEPCPMCIGTIIICHFGVVVWAAPDRRMQTLNYLMPILT